jgi:hypothetical protein
LRCNDVNTSAASGGHVLGENEVDVVESSPDDAAECAHSLQATGNSTTQPTSTEGPTRAELAAARTTKNGISYTEYDEFCMDSHPELKSPKVNMPGDDILPHVVPDKTAPFDAMFSANTDGSAASTFIQPRQQHVQGKRRHHGAEERPPRQRLEPGSRRDDDNTR